MALSNLDKDNLTRLFQMINIDDYSNNQNALANIRNDYINYGKLELIAKQISFLQNEAVNIYNNHQLHHTSSMSLEITILPLLYYTYFIFILL